MTSYYIIWIPLLELRANPPVIVSSLPEFFSNNIDHAHDNILHVMINMSLPNYSTPNESQININDNCMYAMYVSTCTYDLNTHVVYEQLYLNG